MKKIAFVLLAVCLWQTSAVADNRGPVSWITEQVLVGLRQNLTRPLHRTDPVLTTSFVDLNNFDQGSPLGVMLGEYVAVGLTRYGYKVQEIRLDRSNMIVKSQTGEYILTRHVENLEGSPPGKVLLTGTYTLNQDNRLYVTARLVNSMDGSVLSSTLVSVRATNAIRRLCEASLEVRSQPKAVIDEPKEEIAEVESSTPEVEQLPPPRGPYATGDIFLSLNVPDDVRRVQGRLKDLGLYTFRVDGIWGKRSQHALKLFKSVNRLPNPQTWDVETQQKLFYH